MTPRCQRILSAAAKSHVTANGQLRFLIATDWSTRGLPTHGIDVQIRENDDLMLYHGTTRLLVGRIQESGGIVFRAADAYSSWCGAAAKRLLTAWPRPVSATIDAYVEEYLKLACLAVQVHQPHHFAKEGLWQNRLSLMWGRDWAQADHFLLLDREFTLGFDNKDARNKYFAGLNAPYIAAHDVLCKGIGAGWARRSGAAPRELDFLALGPDGALTCVELKHGSNAGGIYWGPLQVGQYRDALQAALPQIGNSISALIEQKIEVGLLPKEARSRLERIYCDRVAAALVITEPPPSHSKVWHRLRAVQAQLGPAHQVDVFTVEDGGTGLALRRWQ